MKAFIGCTYNSRGRSLHRDEDCPHLQRCSDYREVDTSAHPHKEWCRYCTGQTDPTDNQSRGHFESLKAAAQEAAD